MAASAGMRKLAAALLASLITLAAASPAGAQGLPEPKRIPGVGELFVLRAGGGEIERVRAGVFELVLRRPASAVTVFSDRPQRVVREQRLRSFVKGWNGLGFGADPPNAALSIAEAPSARDVLLFELSRPRLGAGGRTLHLRARPLAGRPDGSLRRFAGRADRAGVRRFGRASLFVDPSGQQVTASFQISGIPRSGQAIVDFTNALIDSTTGIAVNVTGGASYVMGPDVFIVAAQSGAPVDATVTLPVSVAAGATRLTGSASLPTGATASVTIGMGAPVALSGGDFSAPLE
jgi:hypothetical protein